MSSASVPGRSDPAGQTFLFADLSGFTALTEAHGDEQAADLVGGFCANVRRLLAEHRAEEVKAIGDALMIRAGDSAAAIRLGLRIVHSVGAQGDWFGATVNLAARVSAAASRGEALLTAATKAAAGKVADVELRERGRWSFRNVAEPVQVSAAVPQGAQSSAGLPIDPVCRMAVDPWHGAGRLTHQGVEYCFCSLGCAGAFAQHPTRYTVPELSSGQQPLTVALARTPVDRRRVSAHTDGGSLGVRALSARWSAAGAVTVGDRTGVIDGRTVGTLPARAERPGRSGHAAADRTSAWPAAGTAGGMATGLGSDPNPCGVAARLLPGHGRGQAHRVRLLTGLVYAYAVVLAVWAVGRFTREAITIERSLD